jgi:hypothetical protein
VLPSGEAGEQPGITSRLLGEAGSRSGITAPLSGEAGSQRGLAVEVRPQVAGAWIGGGA